PIGLAAVMAQSKAQALVDFRAYGIGARLTTIGYSVLFYPRKFLWSANLSAFYPVPATADPLAPPFLLSTIALVTVTGVLLALRRRWPAALAAWLYSALMVLPVSGAAQAGSQLVADRYSYLSGFGFALLPGAGLVWVLRARWTLRPALVGACVLAAVLVLVSLGVGSWRQSTTWRDTGTLWRHAISVDPRNARAHVALGYWLYFTDRQEEARAEYRRALALTENVDVRAV